MLAVSYRKVLQENGCLNLLELQDTAQYLNWKKTSTNEVIFACYLANKLGTRVEWNPFHKDLIASSPNATLAALAGQVKLPLFTQIEEVMTAAVCFKVESDLTMTIVAGDRQHSILCKIPGLPSLRECISRNYGQARWLHEVPGMIVDPVDRGGRNHPEISRSWYWYQ